MRAHRRQHWLCVDLTLDAVRPGTLAGQTPALPGAARLAPRLARAHAALRKAAPQPSPAAAGLGPALPCQLPAEHAAAVAELCAAVQGHLTVLCTALPKCTATEVRRSALQGLAARLYCL